MAARRKKSKKRSAASSPSPPEPLAFFIDRSLGKKYIAEALRAQPGVEIHAHDDHFAADARDEEWLAVVGGQGWVVLTKDNRIRYRSTELTARTQAGVAAFVLAAGNLRGDEMAKVFVEALPAIRRFVARYSRPFVAKITRSGAVELMGPPPK